MDHFKDVEEFNGVLRRANKVKELVENSDWGPINTFFGKVGTKGRNILDVGCATGEIASLVAKHHGGWEFYKGVDLFKDYVDDFNNRRIIRAKAEVGNAVNLSAQRDSSKDIVVCLFLLQHLSKDDGRKALREFARVAKPSADVLIGLTVNPDSIESEKYYAPKEALEAGAKKVLTSIWNKQEFVDAMEQAGFEVLEEPEVIPGQGPYVKLYVRARVRQPM
jgi:ubiquinone/menaquinone biosynthesis C-methylase UbiE